MAVKIERQSSGIEVPGPEVLTGLVRKYKEGPLTPELVTTLWQTFLERSIKTRRLDIAVPTIECDRTPKALETLRKEGGMWVPETKLTLSQLGQIFPEMKCPALQDSSLLEDASAKDVKGVDVEVGIDSPNKNTTEGALKKRLARKGRRGARLSTLILASHISELTTGKYLDENAKDEKITWSRVLGTRYENGNVIVAFFDSSGVLYIHPMDPQRHSSGLGGRSEGVRKVKRRA